MEKIVYLLVRVHGDHADVSVWKPYEEQIKKQKKGEKKMLESYPGHPFLTFIHGFFGIISVFGFAFCAYSLACLYWLKPEDMNVEFTTMSAIVLGIAFVISSPITIIAGKKGRSLVAKEKPKKQFRDLREENK